jgi:hypothetical protein
MIVCPQSPIISAALIGGFEVHVKSHHYQFSLTLSAGTTSKTITVNEFNVRTDMVAFLYSADYRLAPQPETQSLLDSEARALPAN